ncbi:MAG: CcoQ/FixQ family Cbb3-type cytochrome c oxidase assembly chaperone [Proteobacteria bacterium]|nr:MAG: CcoQ/FixQ family Cbb3-type cytochrome c oxidase assembly chaperone [Pseudomonadota bacterium]
MTIEWVGIYKFLRLAIFAAVLVGIVIWAYRPSRKQRLEEPARRMLEEEDDA